MAYENNSCKSDVVTDEFQIEKDLNSTGDISVGMDRDNTEKSESSESETESTNKGSLIHRSVMYVPKKIGQLFRNNKNSDKSYKSDKTLKPGGLNNSKSTCYMNAMIQALSSSDILINSLENLSKSYTNSSVSLLYVLLNALNEENIKDETLWRNTNLLENLIQSVGWTKLSQQDAFDLLTALICDIYKKQNDKLQKIEINQPTKRNPSKLVPGNNSDNDNVVKKKPDKRKGKSTNIDHKSITQINSDSNSADESSVDNDNSNTEPQKTEINQLTKRNPSKLVPGNNSDKDNIGKKIHDNGKGKNSNSADKSSVDNDNSNTEIEIPLGIKLLHEFQGIDFPNTIQEYIGLSVNLCGNYQDPPGVPLQFLINQHFISKAIDGDKSKLTRSSLYGEIPNILLIHIQANKWDPISCRMIKPIYYIQYDENMTLWLDIVNEMNEENRNLNEDRILGTEVKYHLKSIVYHDGNISGGHYVAYRKWRKEWYLANDALIKKKPLNKMIIPYIMIYENQSK